MVGWGIELGLGGFCWSLVASGVAFFLFSLKDWPSGSAEADCRKRAVSMRKHCWQV